MELLTHAKTEYMLDVPLAALHAESLDWLKELGFWADEMSFFYKMLHEKKISHAFQAQDVAAIDKELVKLNGEQLDRVRHDVEGHERLLASLYKSPALSDDQAYRDAHRKLARDMYGLHEYIRAFKQRIMAFIEHSYFQEYV
jgi:hypothetical protein